MANSRFYIYDGLRFERIGERKSLDVYAGRALLPGHARKLIWIVHVVIVGPNNWHVESATAAVLDSNGRVRQDINQASIVEKMCGAGHGAESLVKSEDPEDVQIRRWQQAQKNPLSLGLLQAKLALHDKSIGQEGR